MDITIIAGIGAAIAAVVGLTGTAATIAAIVINVAISYAVSALTAPKVPKGAGAREGRTENIRSSTFPHHVVYGTCRKGGLIFYINGTGTKNEYLHLMLAFATHECEDIEAFYFNGEELPLNGSGFGSPAQPTGNLINHVDLEWKKGASDQAAIIDAVSSNDNWTDDHRARGMCYVWLKLKNSQELFPNFIPGVTGRIKGMNTVWDPRDDSEAWTDNPALIVVDILTRYLGVPRTRIDLTSFISAANICDELVTKKDLTTEKRYRAGGFFELDGDPGEWLEPFVNAMAGNITEHAGIYYINAGKWQEPELTITEDDILSGVRYRTASSDYSRSNAVKGVFVGPDTYDQPTDFPALKDAVAIAEDGGVVNWLEVDLEMVPTHTQAQRVGHIMLQSSREDETLEFSVNLLKGLDIKPWDTVEIDLPSLGLDGTWQVMLHTLNPGSGEDPAMTVGLQLKRHTENVYEWDAATQEQDMELAETNIPGAGGSQPQLVSYSVDLNSHHANHHPADVNLTWTDPEGSILELELEVTMEYEHRITDTDAVTPGNQSGAWIPATITETQTVAEGQGSATVQMTNTGLTDPSGFDFQEWDITLVRARSKIDASTWSDWVIASPA